MFPMLRLFLAFEMGASEGFWLQHDPDHDTVVIEDGQTDERITKQMNKPCLPFSIDIILINELKAITSMFSIEAHCIHKKK